MMAIAWLTPASRMGGTPASRVDRVALQLTAAKVAAVAHPAAAGLAVREAEVVWAVAGLEGVRRWVPSRWFRT